MNQTAVGEAFANLRQRNQFATLTNISLVGLLWLTARQGWAGARMWMAFAGAALLAAGNAASSSRTGMLQLGLLCLLCGSWTSWRRPIIWRVLLVALLAYAVAMLALPWLAGLDPERGMLGRLRAGDAICASRLTLWSNVLHLITQKPWFGWGWGELDYAHYMSIYPGERFCDILDNAHNLPLHLAVELGIPAALLLCGSAIWVVVRTRPWRDRNPTRQMAWAVLAVIGLHSLLEYPLWYGPFQIALGLCVAMLLKKLPESSLQTAGAGSSVKKTRKALYSCQMFAIVTIAFLVYAAWDYYRVSQIYLAPAARHPAFQEDTLIKIRGSWLYRGQVQFAELATTAPVATNASRVYSLANEMLHFSPEPQVIEKLIESAILLGLDEQALLHQHRYRRAFPQDYEKWRSSQSPPRPAL
ncbi:MAG TPA: Wzy polymerase domain-containing protein [Polaromonas sp.]|uniref:PglL family O-oligosaccharyltransferase n=1 Tax=Polaromonas sp. TaxID=1869339 RepID=UPI002D55D4A8|nr:Wzy polymerase domain-containing protein [Polaromonas sp.]HYW56938.1 Wzy polymerase domain-containing protein [Polaromonas sp.]